MESENVLPPLEVTVRPLALGEVPIVAAALPFENAAPDKHKTHYQLQAYGEVTILIAWYETRPVGHLLIRWHHGPKRQQPIDIPEYPHLSALMVHKEYRSRGVGKRLLETAEDICLERGYARFGLNVNVTNTEARALYKSAGFRELGFPPRQRHWTYLDADGWAHYGQETTLYLVKALVPRRNTQALPP